MHNKKKWMALVVLICIAVLLIFGIIRIWALFHSELDGDIKFENGTWNIFVNDEEISRGTDKEFVIDNIDVSSNEHIKAGNIAPGLSASFNIKIDPKDTNVSIKYEISLDEDKINSKNIKIKQVTETEYNNQLEETDGNKYAGIIPLSDIQNGHTNTIKVEIEWVEDEENNEEDIAVGSADDPKIEIPVIVHVEQYV